ncbi:hypothetical protein [Flavobacterium hungaricum]|uniref:Uncharacterized protein n=1 Tax=Flavobacterium hungaricum TaxID=2082725 RepID=A0ABR9TFE1_9FLAO|nr:hypothetical protein [Flavobacterium hungaricum]MBE8724068.1 hypothetical protein [Flavobacterium hungaricum]
MKNILLNLIIIFSFTNTYAGWYKCYNYKGTIDKYPISFSIQITDGYFGEKQKKDFNINGVYKYDKHNNPIKLEGKINFKTNRAYIYEIQNNKNAAVFEFNFSEKECNGTWTDLNTKKVLSLSLNFTSKLIDTAKNNAFHDIEILQLNSLADYYFVGVYSKQNDQDSAQMDHLKIIRKNDNSIFQILDFSNIETETGNVITIIYQNVETGNSKSKDFIIWNNVGRMGGYLTVKYLPVKRKFKVNPNPTIDGPP